MIEFKDYIKERENLNESLLGTVALAIGTVFAGITVLAWVGVGASWILTAWGRNVGKAIKTMKKIWKGTDKNFSDKELRDRLINLSNSTETKKQIEKIEKAEDKYSEELSGVYSAIENKDWSLAAEKFNDLSYLKNNPDVVKAIINKISEVNEEPPLYINSPGNSTYQAIKKIINLKTAKAAADATKKALG